LIGKEESFNIVFIVIKEKKFKKDFNMKKISGLLIVLSLVMAFSCSYTVDSVVGKWKCTKDTTPRATSLEGITFDFQADGKCTFGWLFVEYSVSGSEITWKGEKYSLFINGNKMTWSNIILGTVEFEKQ